MSDTELTYAGLRNELARRVFQYVFSGPLLLVWSIGMVTFLIIFDRPLFALVWSGTVAALGLLMAVDYLRSPRVHERLIPSIFQEKITLADRSMKAGVGDEGNIFTEIILKIFQIDRRRGPEPHLPRLISLTHGMVSLLRGCAW